MQLFENSNWVGIVVYQEGDYEGVVLYFEVVDSVDSLYNCGNALVRSGDLDAAIAAYRKSLELAPEQQDALDNIALLEKLKQQQQQQQDQQQDGEQQDQQNQQ